MQPLSAFVACESKSNQTIIPTLLMNKLLFRDISYNFLIIVLITTNSCVIVIVIVSSNELGITFNCNTNLVMPMSLLLVSNKRNLTHVIFWTKGKLFYKNPLKSQSSNHKSRIHKIWTRKSDFFTSHAKKTSDSRRNKK